jgi:hypothetical protein
VSVGAGPTGAPGWPDPCLWFRRVAAAGLSCRRHAPVLASGSHGPDDGQREENNERESSEEDEHLLELLNRRWGGE